MKAKGLGDVIENITVKTGIKTVVEKTVGKDCGCAKRRDSLNRMFPFEKK